MENFYQPSMYESLASQGMTLRGGTIRANQDNTGERDYTDLTNPTKEMDTTSTAPLPRRSRSLSLPPCPAPVPPLKFRGRYSLETPPPPTLSNSTEMSTDDFCKVSQK